MANITLTVPHFYTSTYGPTLDDVLFVGLRKELVVATVQPDSNHGHLIRTLSRDDTGLKERTYSLDYYNDEYRLVELGSASGPIISKQYEGIIDCLPK